MGRWKSKAKALRKGEVENGGEKSKLRGNPDG